MPKPDREEPGIGGLPRRWAVPVQLVGTFGLAVFLVLYYVLVIQPRDAANYRQLAEAVAKLKTAVDSRAGLLSREQVGRLEALFARAAAPEVAALLQAGLKAKTPAADLEGRIRRVLRERTEWIQGFAREDGAVLSEQMVHALSEGPFIDDLVKRAVEEWGTADAEKILEGSREALERTVRRKAMAK